MGQTEVKRVTKAFYYSPAQWNFTFKTNSKGVLILQWQRKGDSKSQIISPSLFLVPDSCLVPSHHTWSHCFWNTGYYSSGSVWSYNYRLWEDAIYYFTVADVLVIQLCHNYQLDPVLWLKKKKTSSIHTLKIYRSSEVKCQTIQSLPVNIFEKNE